MISRPPLFNSVDTDLYKFTMLQVVLHKFPVTSVYQFRCRNLEDTAYPLSDILAELNAQLDHLCQLYLKNMNCSICVIYALLKVTLSIIYNYFSSSVVLFTPVLMLRKVVWIFG